MNEPSLQKKIFSSQQLADLDLKKIPRHVTIVPDGNRRWAKKHNLAAYAGHRKGGDNLIEIVKAAKELGIKTISFYLFSTENWSRDPLEVDALMWLLHHFLTKQRPVMLEYGIKVSTIGDLSPLPPHALNAISEAKLATADCSAIDMVMALNYGSRNEICRAIRSIVTDIEEEKIAKKSIDEKLISRYLDTAAWGDPDLFIRTSGEMRLSNYLLWQISYAEICISDVLWPDFGPDRFLEVLLDFQMRERRLGGM